MRPEITELLRLVERYVAAECAAEVAHEVCASSMRCKVADDRAHAARAAVHAGMQELSDHLDGGVIDREDARGVARIWQNERERH